MAYFPANELITAINNYSFHVEQISTRFGATILIAHDHKGPIMFFDNTEHLNSVVENLTDNKFSITTKEKTITTWEIINNEQT